MEPDIIVVNDHMEIRLNCNNVSGNVGEQSEETASVSQCKRLLGNINSEKCFCGMPESVPIV